MALKANIQLSDFQIDYNNYTSPGNMISAKIAGVELHNLSLENRLVQPIASSLQLRRQHLKRLRLMK